MDLLKMKYLFIFVSLVALTQLIFSQSNTLVLKNRISINNEIPFPKDI